MQLHGCPVCRLQFTNTEFNTCNSRKLTRSVTTHAFPKVLRALFVTMDNGCSLCPSFARCAIERGAHSLADKKVSAHFSLPRMLEGIIEERDA